MRNSLGVFSDFFGSVQRTSAGDTAESILYKGRVKSVLNRVIHKVVNNSIPERGSPNLTRLRFEHDKTDTYSDFILTGLQLIIKLHHIRLQVKFKFHSRKRRTLTLPALVVSLVKVFYGKIQLEINIFESSFFVLVFCHFQISTRVEGSQKRKLKSPVLSPDAPHIVAIGPRVRVAVARIEILVPCCARLSRRNDRARPKVTGRLEADKNRQDKRILTAFLPEPRFRHPRSRAGAMRFCKNPFIMPTQEPGLLTSVGVSTIHKQ